MKNMLISILTIFAVIVGMEMTLFSPSALAGPHTKGCYVCKADNDDETKYYRCVTKRSDDQETAFKQAVNADAGVGCRKVSYPDKKPTDGKEI